MKEVFTEQRWGYIQIQIWLLLYTSCDLSLECLYIQAKNYEDK